MNRHLRWLALIPVAVAAWFAAAAFTYVAWLIALRFCPPELMISGTCMAPWFSDLEQALLYFGVALSGVLVVALPSIAAPRHKARVAWVALASGAVVASIITREIHPYTIIPVVAGTVVAALITWRGGRKHDA